jgi:succinyl-diaminopimelate desuccinylase
MVEDDLITIFMVNCDVIDRSRTSTYCKYHADLNFPNMIAEYFIVTGGDNGKYAPKYTCRRFDMARKGLKAIDEEYLVRLTKELVQIPSVNPPGQYEEITSFVANEWKNLGLDVTRVVPSKKEHEEAGLETTRIDLVAQQHRPEEGRNLVFDIHSDVVSPGGGWTVDPFAGVMKDGRVYGRGSSDAKGGLAAFTAAVECLLRSEVAFNGSLTLVLSVDDEIGGTLGSKYLLEKKIINPDSIIVAEGTNRKNDELDIASIFGGRLWIETEVKGKAAHAGRAREGINAIDKTIELVTAMEQKVSLEPHALYPGIVNLGTIHGGTRTNVVPDSCTTTFDLRFGPNESTERILTRVDRIAKDLSASDGKFNLTKLRVFERRDGFQIDPGSPMMKSLSGNIKDVTGRGPKMVGAAGSGDAFWYWNIKKAPVVFFGPGNTSIHSADEYVTVKALKSCATIYALTALDLLS